MKELIKKFKDGDSLEDNELRSLILHYQTLLTLLKPHGTVYNLVYMDCYHAHSTLVGYQEARKR